MAKVQLLSAGRLRPSKYFFRRLTLTIRYYIFLLFVYRMHRSPIRYPVNVLRVLRDDNIFGHLKLSHRVGRR